MERWEDAMRMLKKEEDLCKEVGDIKALAENYGNQAQILTIGKELDKAMELYKKEESMCMDTNYRMGLINNYARQAVVFLEKEQFDKSLVLFDQAAGICIESNYIPGLPEIYANKGSLLAHHMNDKPAGIALLQKAIDIAKKLKSGQLQQLYAMLDEIKELPDKN